MSPPPRKKQRAATAAEGEGGPGAAGSSGARLGPSNLPGNFGGLLGLGGGGGGGSGRQAHGVMQANGNQGGGEAPAAQNGDATGRDGPAEEPASHGSAPGLGPAAAHSNGMPSSSSSSSLAAATPLVPGPGGVSTDQVAYRKKKRLCQSDEDVIRLIGQHLHGLGLK